VTDVDDARRVVIVEREPVIGGARPLNEKLDGGRLQGVLYTRALRTRRQAEWRQAGDPLTRRAQRLAACRQQVHLRRSSPDLLPQHGRGVDEMLAIVEHEQHLPVPHPGDQIGRRIVR
jgi:hypothetical protein